MDLDALKEAAGPELAETLEKLVSLHGVDDLAVVRTACGPAIFRTPTRAEYKRHLSLATGGTKDGKVDSIEQLVRACVVHPSKETFADWIERKPAIPVACIEAITALAGMQAKEVEGK